MQALIAPAMAALGGGAGVATATAALGAAAPIFSGLAGMQQARSEKQRAEINAYIGKTRAIQADTTAREGLSSELATLRNAFGPEGQSVGTGALFDEMRRVRGVERRIEFGNNMGQAADFRQQAKGIKPGYALAGGLLKAGPSLMTLYDMGRK